MYDFVPLVKEYRGKLLDLTHFGYLCIVDENSNVVYSAGDPDAQVFYRSSSKPIQALPVIAMGLVDKYGISPEESVIFAGSHTGMECHINALESILAKTGLKEDMLCMKPAVPFDSAENEKRIRNAIPPRKLYHNCAGKHLALMLVQRELGGKPEDYWKEDSLAQKEIMRTISVMSETENIDIGIDGCGVPVFALPMKSFATSYKNLACINTIKDEGLSKAAAALVPHIHEYPHMMRGYGYLCTLINEDANIVGKGGANGAYGFALKKERLGVAFKFTDGTEHCWPIIVHQVLKGLGVLTPETDERLLSLKPYNIYNDNDTLVGYREPCFDVSVK